jgi:alkylated DNA repair protein alkB family protein 1
MTSKRKRKNGQNAGSSGDNLSGDPGVEATAFKSAEKVVERLQPSQRTRQRPHPPTAANASAQLYKCYKDGRPPPSFDQVIDVDREHSEVEEVPLPEGTPEWLHSSTRVYLLRGVDGFRLLRSPLSAAQQLQLVEAALSEWIEPPVITNLNLHHGPCARLWSRHREQSDPDGSLLARLSWATLGQHYRWTERAYEAESRPDTVPPALAQLTAELASAAGEAVHPQAAIVNFYGADSTMGGHLDDAEPCQTAPIVSLSLGLDAIYLIGGPTKAEPPRAVWLRSGDVIIQGGESRGFYHGVPRVVAGTLPPALEQAAATPGQREVVAWLREHRMNVNVRQVYPS